MRAIILLLASVAVGQYIPSGAHIHRNARKLEDIEWDRVKRSKDIQAIESYQNRFPKSKHAAEALRLLDKLGVKERSRSADTGNDYTLVPDGKDLVRVVPADSK